MGSVRRRRANKAGVKKTTRRTKDKQREVNIASNPIIAANWDYSLTLSQNYKKLGLKAKLGTIAGGIEKELNESKQKKFPNLTKQKNNEKIIGDTEDEIPEGEAKILRDEKGEVIKVIYGKKKVSSSDDSKDDDDKEEKTEVIKQLEAFAKSRAPPKERVQSEREQDWIKSLFEKHGDDYAAMMWDKKLNIYQQSSGDLRRRVLKWKKQNGIN